MWLRINLIRQMISVKKTLIIMTLWQMELLLLAQGWGDLIALVYGPDKLWSHKRSMHLPIHCQFLRLEQPSCLPSGKI
jgi:hypothetical protein